MGFLDDMKKNLGFSAKERHHHTAGQAPAGTTAQPTPADSAAGEAAAQQTAAEEAAARQQDAADRQPDAAGGTAQEAVAEQAGAAPAQPGQVTEVVVEPGDTLSSIALQFGVEVDALLAANAETVPNPDLIYPGQVLRLP